MKVLVTVKPNSKERRVETLAPNHLRVRVPAPPHEDRANQELIETLSDHFRVPKSRISIVRGFRSKQKIVEIQGPTPPER